MGVGGLVEQWVLDIEETLPLMEPEGGSWESPLMDPDGGSRGAPLMKPRGVRIVIPC